MKRIYLIAIAFLASWTVIPAEESAKLEAENECPEKDTCPPKLLFHESDCSKYYECKNGKKVLQECAPGLHFSKKWGGCLQPYKSECNSSITDCRQNGDLLAHECDCFKFYECNNNRKILHECPSGEHFSKKFRSCIEGSTCRDDEIASLECVEGINIPHECKCDQYYICKDNKRILRKCEEGSNFNNQTRTCIQGPCNNTACVENTRKPHECECNKYYICENVGKVNEWIIEDCPSGEHFNKETETCMHRLDAGCEIPGNCTNSDERWSHECDCRLYYRCINNKKEILSCPWGRYFNKNKLICEYADDIKDCKNKWDDWWLTK